LRIPFLPIIHVLALKIKITFVMVSIFAKKIFSDADVKPKASCKGLAKVVSTMFGNFKNEERYGRRLQV